MKSKSFATKTFIVFFATLFSASLQLTIQKLSQDDFKNHLASKPNFCNLSVSLIPNPYYKTRLFGAKSAIKGLKESEGISAFFNEKLFVSDDAGYEVSAATAAKSFINSMTDKDGLFCLALVNESITAKDFAAYSSKINAALEEGKPILTDVEFVNLVHEPLLSNPKILEDFYSYAKTVVKPIAEANPYGVKERISSRFPISITEMTNVLLELFEKVSTLVSRMYFRFNDVRGRRMSSALESYYKILQLDTEVGMKLYFRRNYLFGLGDYNEVGSILYYFLKVIYKNKVGKNFFIDFVTSISLFEGFVSNFPVKTYQALIDHSSERLWSKQKLYEESIIVQAITKNALLGFMSEEISNSCFMVFREKEISSLLNVFKKIPLVLDTQDSFRPDFMSHMFSLLASYDADSELFYDMPKIDEFISKTKAEVSNAKNKKSSFYASDFNSAKKYAYAILNAKEQFKTLLKRIEQLNFLTIADFQQNKSLLKAIEDHRDVLGLAVDMSSANIKDSYFSNDAVQRPFIDSFVKAMSPLVASENELNAFLNGMLSFFCLSSTVPYSDFVTANNTAIMDAKKLIATDINNFVPCILSENLGQKMISSVANKDSVATIQGIIEKEQLDAASVGTPSALSLPVPRPSTFEIPTEIVHAGTEKPTIGNASFHETNAVTSVADQARVHPNDITKIDNESSEEVSGAVATSAKPDAVEETRDLNSTVNTSTVAVPAEGVKPVQKSGITIAKVAIYVVIVLAVVGLIILVFFFIRKRQNVKRNRNEI